MSVFFISQLQLELIHPIQTAVSVHYAALTGAVEAFAIVPLPDPDNQAAFSTRFASTAAMDLAAKGPEIIPRDIVSVVSIYEGMNTEGVMAAQVSLIDNDTIARMIELCAKFGITRAVHDPRQAKDSLWNEGVAKIFMRSFRAALAAGDYDYLHANKQFADTGRAGDLRKLYNHVVHRQGKRTLSELRRPGALVEQERRASVYQYRTRVSLHPSFEIRSATEIILFEALQAPWPDCQAAWTSCRPAGHRQVQACTLRDTLQPGHRQVRALRKA